MKKILLNAAAGSLLILVSFVLPGCGKKNDGTGDGTTPPTNCKLLKQSTNVILTNPQYYAFDYDANGNVSKISLSYNGALQMVETVQPTQMIFKDNTSSAVDHAITYNVSYLDKQPANAIITSNASANKIPQAYTYDSKGRMATVLIGETSAIKISFTYDSNNNVTSITYHSDSDGDYATFIAKGYDDHPSPYSGLKNSVYLQFTFTWDGVDLVNTRYIFDQLSAHNILGYQASGHGASVLSEAFTYTYNDKGLPVQRDAALSNADGVVTKHYYDAWEYDCK